MTYYHDLNYKIKYQDSEKILDKITKIKIRKKSISVNYNNSTLAKSLFMGSGAAIVEFKSENKNKSSKFLFMSISHISLLTSEIFNNFQELNQLNQHQKLAY